MSGSDPFPSERITPAALYSALTVQGRVIKGLILRETKSRYGRHKLGFFWIFFEPMLMTGLFVAFKLLIASPTSGGMPDTYFIITGVVPFVLFRQCMGALETSIVRSRSLLAFPQVTTMDVIISIALLEFATIFLVFAVMVSGTALFGVPNTIEKPLLVLYGTVLLGITGCGMGMIFASIIPLMPAVKNISGLIFGRPLFFTSGVFFTADMLPEVARNVLLYNPLLHMVEMVRSGFFVQFESEYMDIHFATLFALCVFLLGLLMHQVLRDHVVKVA